MKLPGSPADGEGLGVKGWREYANVLKKRATRLRSELDCDPGQRMKKQRLGRGVRLTRMTEPASQDTGVEDGGAPGQAAFWSAGKPRIEVGFG